MVQCVVGLRMSNGSMQYVVCGMQYVVGLRMSNGSIISCHSEEEHCRLMGRLSEELCDYRRSNKILSMDWDWEREPRV